MSSFQVTDILVECQKNPIGLDQKKPRFSWKLKSKERGCRQSAYHIICGTKEGVGNCFDSGKVVSNQSNEIFWEGKELKPCTKYFVKVSVWNEKEEMQTGTTFFETGLLNTKIEAFEGAQWIGAPKYSVSADTRGIFRIESEFEIERGGKGAGIIFGRNDRRLLDSAQNEYGLAGEHYIAYEINVEEIPAQLHIYRVGYEKGDEEYKPFASMPIAAMDDPTRLIIHEQNKHLPHRLSIEVTGNCAFAYIDDVLVDGIWDEHDGGHPVNPRQLNPRGDNDVITYPRLCQIGFYVREQTKAAFYNITVRNLRTPRAVYIDERPMDSLYGKETIYQPFLQSREIKVLNNAFTVEGKESVIKITVDPSNTSIPMLRAVFHVEKNSEVKAARLYVTARGIYDVRVNGKQVTKQWFQPGCSQFDKHIMYQTYDITPLLCKNKNGIGFVLASGWWSDAQTYALQNYNYYGDKEAVLGKLVITYQDGTRKVLTTNTEDFKYYGKGPYMYAGFFHGEHYDAGRESIYHDFSKPEFDDSDWESPVVVTPVRIKSWKSKPVDFGRAWPQVNKTEPEITGDYQAPVLETERIQAQKVTNPKTGLYIYDLEQEIAGVPCITFHEKPGTKVVIRYGEMLYPKHSAYPKQEGMILLENYRDADNTDLYTCKGGEETYQPKFTYHGFRYIEVSGVNNPPKLCEVTGVSLSSVHYFTGDFQCSNALINRFVSNVKWSQRCNFISIPTDCPQRNERMGWSGDTHVFTRTAMYNSDTRLFYYRNLQAFADLQTKGRFPEIAPVGGGFGGITYETGPIFMVWEIYQQYGDKKVIELYYENLCDYMDYLDKVGMPGIVDVGPLGDWLAVEETDVYLLWNAFYGYAAKIMKKLSKIIKNTEKICKFSGLETEIKSYFNENFVDRETKKTCTKDGHIVDTQCSYALPLCFGMFDEDFIMSAGEHLHRKVKENGYKITTGFFGTGCISEALTMTGHVSDAYRLITQTAYPSWLYPVTQGATTIWERWDSFTYENGFGGNNNMNSFNHYSLGSVLYWMYAYVSGIKRLEEFPGFKRFLLKPHIEEFEYAEGKIETIYGEIKSSWKRKGADQIDYQCTVPPNTKALICLPAGTITEHKKQLNAIDTIQIQEENKNEIKLEVSAGEYSFVIKKG